MFLRELWQRHFLGEPTRGQRVFDAVVGIVLPLLCVLFDPVVFTRHSISDSSDGILTAFQAPAYVEIALQVALLGLWLCLGRRLLAVGGIFAGAFLVGAVFSLWVGCWIFLPSLLCALMGGIGLPGFTPLLAAFVYGRNGVRAFLAGESRLGPAAVVLLAFPGAALAVALPLGGAERVNRWIGEAEAWIVQARYQGVPPPAPVAFLAEQGQDILAVGGKDGMVQFQEAATGVQVRTIPTGLDSVRRLAVFGDWTTGWSILAAAGRRGGVRLLDARSGALLREHSAPELQEVTALAFSPDGALLALAGRGGGFTLIDPRTGGVLRSFACDGRILSALAFPPDGLVLACGSRTIDGEAVGGRIELRDPVTGAALRTLETFFRSFPTSLAFSPDGRFLASGEWSCYPMRGGGWFSYPQAQVFEWQRGEVRKSIDLRDLSGPWVDLQGLSVAFSPDGKTLAVGAEEGVACLWEWEEEHCFRWLPLPPGAASW